MASTQTEADPVQRAEPKPDAENGSRPDAWPISDAAPESRRALVHANNFDAIRLFAALLVLVSHQLFFLGRAQPLIAGRTPGDIAVLMFFVISGYLVAESWYRDPNVVRFALRRFLRIWPGLAAATLVILLLSASLTSLPPRAYFGHATGDFLARNLQLRIVYTLPGVFGSDGGALSAVNGSWWSIPLEAKCYVLLAVLGLIGLRRRWVSMLALVVVAALFVRTLPGHPQASSLHNLRLYCIAFFLTGVGAYQWRASLLRWRMPAAGVIVVVFAGALVAGQRDVALWVALAPLVLVAGSLRTPVLRAASRYGDFSYGIYIYAYFVQQVSVRVWPGARFPIASTLLSAAAALAIAWCSWHLVEASALGLKRHLRRWFPDHAA